MRWIITVVAAFLGSVALAGTSGGLEPATMTRQSRADAWWTGPLLANSAATLPRGHVLIEPYLFNAMSRGFFDQHGNHVSAAGSDYYGSTTYFIYGLSDRVSIGAIPRFAYQHAANEPSSVRVRAGDLSLQAQYRFMEFSEQHPLPTVSLLVIETLPTGKYDRLYSGVSDGIGAGAYTTTLSLCTQYYFWTYTGRILRTRFNVAYSASGAATVSGASVYGTPNGFHGHANSDGTLNIDLAGEYSLSKRWVLALDGIYEHSGITRVTGDITPGQSNGAAPRAYRSESGTSRYFALAPAIEFNWSSNVGLIVGARFIVNGRNTSASVTPIAAINLFY